MLRLRLDRRLPERLRIGAELVELRLRALDGGPLFVRPRTSDLNAALHDYVDGFHLPPEPARDWPLERVVELGCNVGAALCWYATRHPQARILGVEPDPANAALARRNLSRFGDRCEVVGAAIWSESAELVLEPDEAHSIRVRAAEPGDRERGTETISALGVGELLSEHLAPEEPIDLLLISVEGCERQALSGAEEWAPRVRAIRMELNQHLGGPSRPEAEGMLAALGFETWSDDWLGSSAYGVRRDDPA